MIEGVFGAVSDLYRREYLPALEPCTRQTNSYLLKNYIEPKFVRISMKWFWIS